MGAGGSCVDECTEERDCGIQPISVSKASASRNALPGGLMSAVTPMNVPI